MADLVEAGLAWLVDRLRRHASRTVIYRRGEASVSLSAILGRSEFRDAETQDFATQFQSRDFLVKTNDLDLGEGPTLPLPGDTVECDGATFEVLDIPGAACFRFTDPYRTALRIHTKEIE